MRVLSWNIRSFYTEGTPMTVLGELFKYKLDLMGLTEVRWVRGGTKSAGEYTFFYAKGNKNHEVGMEFLCRRELYQQLRG
jgi:hypothetical protein